MMNAWAKMKEIAGDFKLCGKWLLLVFPMAALVGSATSLFLWSLERATIARFDHPWLLYLLPIAGVAIGYLYHWLGKSAEGGTNLLLDEIHEPGVGVPRRMAPLILVSTVVTHLFGGSAGREGTALQMGGSIAGVFTRRLKLSRVDTSILLMAGIAAGFGAVFGTPLAGTIFAIEVLAIGRMRYEALLPCLMAAMIGDWVCRAWGIGHTHYHIAYLSELSQNGRPMVIEPIMALKVVMAAVLFGLVGAGFARMTYASSNLFRRICPSAPWRPAIGGVVIILLVHLLGTREYLGLGVWSPDPSDATISTLVEGKEYHPWSWWWKIVFTVVTLGAGFKGGEVTPLFFIGAGLGHALALPMGMPMDMLAALGFVAVFAGATNTPLACTIMGIELFGSQHAVAIAVACFVAYLCSGHNGIYKSQRVAVAKNNRHPAAPTHDK